MYTVGVHLWNEVKTMPLSTYRKYIPGLGTGGGAEEACVLRTERESDNMCRENVHYCTHVEQLRDGG